MTKISTEQGLFTSPPGLTKPNENPDFISPAGETYVETPSTTGTALSSIQVELVDSEEKEKIETPAKDESEPGEESSQGFNSTARMLMLAKMCETPPDAPHAPHVIDSVSDASGISYNSGTRMDQSTMLVDQAHDVSTEGENSGYIMPNSLFHEEEKREVIGSAPSDETDDSAKGHNDESMNSHDSMSMTDEELAALSAKVFKLNNGTPVMRGGSKIATSPLANPSPYSLCSVASSVSTCPFDCVEDYKRENEEKVKIRKAVALQEPSDIASSSPFWGVIQGALRLSRRKKTSVAVEDDEVDLNKVLDVDEQSDEELGVLHAVVGHEDNEPDTPTKQLFAENSPSKEKVLEEKSTVDAGQDSLGRRKWLGQTLSWNLITFRISVAIALSLILTIIIMLIKDRKN